MLLRLTTLALLAACAHAGPADHAPSAGPEAWSEITLWRLPEAMAAFDSPEADRLARLGRATVLLELPPKTPGNLAEVDRILRGLVETRADDEPGIVAAWLLARLHHVHLNPAVPAEAARWYRHLHGQRAFRAHPLVAQAAVKLALLTLYADDGRPFETRYAEAKALGTDLADQAARRDFHLLLARAAQFHGQPESLILPHLLAALGTGELGHREHANVLYTIADLGPRVGRIAEARAAAAHFLERFPRDERVLTVRQKLAALPPSDS